MPQNERPNIVFVFADDWGWGDLGCYGHAHLQTPNLDRFAAEGTLYSQFYVCSGVCSPSRAAVLTGRFPARDRIHGHFADHDFNARRGMPNFLDPQRTTYAHRLRDAGYRVGHFGKWHLGHGPGAPPPTEYGIEACRVNAGNGPQLDFPVVVSDEHAFLRGNEQQRLAAGPRTRSTEVIVDESLAFIDRHRDDPFCVNVWLNDTHATLDPDAEMLERYEHAMPQGVSHKHVGANAIYWATVTEADRQIGRLLEKLDAWGLRDNTLVIFSADNGPEDICIRNASYSGVGSAGPFRGRKRSLYEGGLRVPFLVRWPAGGATPGTIDHDTPLCAADLAPTFCELAGVDPPSADTIDGESVTDVLRGAARPRRRPMMWDWRFPVAGHTLHKSPRLALRQDRWKLLLNPDRDRVELYDVPADPMELCNLADCREDILDRLAPTLLDWADALPEGPVDPTAGSNAYPWPGRASGPTATLRPSRP